ncbi:E3 SUMO-protein ligase ZBED1-like [Daktulosphaira vitifoliae]|uniref:E3 SUMO-protein ligase ZBED1-like n=1 Tax=Daktulosphaira vitifoliae TaxID=58002 RepID=UPI0021A98A45|nr:E3 SUMO-protein ligase ZBED1-like [Daktulosphaira vitifoliae]
MTFNNWEIDQKVTAVVTDNAKNVLNAVNLLDNITEKNDITCAAHTLQLAVNNALKYDKINNLIQLCSKIVCHFKHSNLASQYLKDKQEQLGMPTESLIQSCKTRLNSIFMMLDRIYKNRCPISNVLADRSLTTEEMAHKFEVSEHQWTNVETLIKLLKPLQIMTTVFCGDKYCSSSMVRPLLNAVIKKHLKHNISDDEIAENFKTNVIRELSDHFKLLWTPSSVVSARQIASFLDPRFKDLKHETVDAREEIRTQVKNLIKEMAEFNRDVQIEIPVTKHHGALEYLFSDEVNCNIADSDIQYQNYLAEPQLKFDFDALEWWKTRTSKYPLIVALAMKYLGIPATSVSSERCFSTAGNIVTAKKSFLAPETVNMLIFLYQNKQLL